jgi:hypothetical protein
VDSIAELFAKQNNIKCTVFLPQYETYWKFWLKFDPLFWLKMTHLQIKIVPLFFVILIF